MAKTLFYKLSSSSSIFFDAKSQLKVTKGVPGKTTVKTKKIIEGVRSGHIIEIHENEYESLMSKLPEATQKAVKYEQAVPIARADAKKAKEDENNAGDDPVRADLIARLNEFEISDKELKKALKKDNDDLTKYVEDLEAQSE